MNTISRTITGIIAIIIAAGIIYTALTNDLVLLIYGLPILILGIFILFNTKEDEIEQIKSSKKHKEK